MFRAHPLGRRLSTLKLVKILDAPIGSGELVKDTADRVLTHLGNLPQATPR